MEPRERDIICRFLGEIPFKHPLRSELLGSLKRFYAGRYDRIDHELVSA